MATKRDKEMLDSRGVAALHVSIGVLELTVEAVQTAITENTRTHRLHGKNQLARYAYIVLGIDILEQRHDHSGTQPYEDIPRRRR